MNIDRKTVQLMNKYAGHEYYIPPDLIDDYEDDEIIDFMHKTIIGMEQKLMEEIKDLQQSVKNTYDDFVQQVSKNRKIEKNFIIKNVKAMIYDSKTAKKKFLIDDILSLESVIKKIAEDLKIKNYQVIENNNYSLNFFGRLFNANFLQGELDYFYKLRDENICEVLNYELSSIIVNRQFVTNC